MARGATRKPAKPKGPPCANCDTALVGPYCHACGQKAHLHNRLSHLLEELVEGIAHFDGRLWRTLPLLAFDPGRLSREWREGKRMRYIAPLHVFLFAVFLVFTIPAVTGGHVFTFAGPTAAQPDAVAPIKVDGDLKDAPPMIQSIVKGLEKRGEKAEYYGYKIETLVYKLSFMVVPISMGILALLLWWKRGYTLYDHGTVALYGVGFLSLILAVLLPLPLPAQVDSQVLGFACLGLLAHAIVHLKGAYALGWPAAVGIGVLQALLSVFGFAIFLIAVVALGLAG